MSQRLTIDLKKNPEAAQVTADMEVGAKVALYGAIFSKDDQTLVVEMEEIEGDGESAEGIEDNDDNADGEGVADATDEE